MNDSTAALRLDKLEAALDRLTEALAVEDARDLAVDGTIQRFELTFDLSWKAAKAVLELEGVRPTTPRQSLQAAYQAGIIDDEEVWLAMLRDRNASSHTYEEATALALYERIPGYREAVARLLEGLTERLGG